MIQTDINYPDGLPWPTREGYSTRSESPFIRTKLSSGRARQRRMYTSVPSEYKVNFIFEGDFQVGYFELWFKEVLKDGAEWFNAKLKTPLGLGYYVCRFSEMYDGPDLVGLCNWRISATLEMWERPLLDKEFLEFPEYMLESSIIDIAVNEKWPAA